MHLITSGEAAAATGVATVPADEPAHQSSQSHRPAPMNPHGEPFQSIPTAQQSEGWSDCCETASASVPAAQTQSGPEAEFSQPQTLGESTTLVNSPSSASQPGSQQDREGKPMPQHPLQHQLPNHGQLPSDPPTQHQQVGTHQPTHSQHVVSQQARGSLLRQDSSQQQEGKSPQQPEQMAASQGSSDREPQHSRAASRHAGLPYFHLKLIREACHTVMTLAEKRGQPALMLPLLQRMQQVCNRSPTQYNFRQG